MFGVDQSYNTAGQCPCCTPVTMQLTKVKVQ
uniref:Uncharacterized protein n=1 Tax=Anguilla anguilla TaxID=7936 RepID=A0A0E9VW12_ANGAN